MTNRAAVTLTVDPSGLSLNCQFFSTSQIEFDLWSADIADPEMLERLLDFMRAVGELFGKPIFLTPENMADASLISFDPATGKLTVSP